MPFSFVATSFVASSLTRPLAGFEPRELIGQPSLDLVHPDEFPQVRAIHYSTITQDQAAVLVYLRMRHKDPCKGYVLCAIVRTTTLSSCPLSPRFVPVTDRVSERPRGERVLRIPRTKGHAQRLDRPGSHHHHTNGQRL